MKNCSTCVYPTENCGKFTCNCGDSDMYEKEIAGDTTCDCWEEN